MVDAIFKKTLVKNKIYILISVVLLTGIMLRYLVMFWGHNYDFDSYCIVGRLVSESKNVYANTSRYNYGPMFLYIQGLCYKLSLLTPNYLLTYRLLIVFILCLGDIGIACFLYKKYSPAIAFVFFLNPVSIIITGYHNQFDNLAVWAALLSSQYFNEDKKITLQDLFFVIIMSICLITKHILFMMPIWLLISKRLPFNKKIIYSFLPILLYMTSFIPFIVNDVQAVNGVLKNVFLYRSFNNSPLFYLFYKIFKIPDYCYFYIFIIIICFMGWYFRDRKYQDNIMLYLLCLISFSSAIANQYLVIPVAALCVFSKYIKYLYFIIIGGFLIFEGNGLHLYALLTQHGYITNIYSKIIFNIFIRGGYSIACFLCFVVLINEIISYKNKKVDINLN
jgi:hypothetical protein